jgi:Ca2+-dependent lipid-binding protein
MLDPYVRVQTYAETLRVRVIYKTKNPIWNQDIKFQVMDPLGKSWTQGIMLEIVDYSATSKVRF